MPTVGLGPWWICAGAGVVAVVVIGSGAMLLGAGLIAATFVLAAGLRAVLPKASCGGLLVRSRALDITVCLAVAINVFGAALMVERLVAWQVLGLIDLVVAAVLAVVLYTDDRRRQGRPRRPGRPRQLAH